MLQTVVPGRRAASWLSPPCLILALGLLGACATPPDVPDGTDIFMVPLALDDGGWSAGPLLRVTDRDGYDNQPAFTHDGSRLLYSSRRGGQVDVYAFDPAERRSQRLTETLESEYSPTPIPDDPRVSVVRVERDGRQRLWALDEGSEFPELLLDRPEYVGYHAWADRLTVVLQLLGEPTELHVADLSSGRLSAALARDVGRSLQRVPGRRAVSYVQHDPEGAAWIHELDLASGRSRPIVAALPGAEDHVWLPDGSLLMAQDGVLLCWGPGTLGLWAEVADYSGDGLADITRLAVDASGRALAFVARH